ncbi:hypothetical protein HPB52_025686 [Rhipicephalus sanguineus]|uniref:RUN domain-containing protein n=1 Tax=Rhipicephalus sanguineus TaxID=34632 RepID=A0A9D4YRA6_RHISA|nr:hypothetical protein HPB52_025686 [Rhipicephalus sanguineus]
MATRSGEGSFYGRRKSGTDSLQEPQWGYWPWVRKFTHPAAQQEIASLSAVSTDLGYGRAWLLASLNGGLLESYMLSFRQNLRLLRKGYSLNSLLRDPQGVSVMTISSTDSSTSSREDDSGIQSVRVSCATLSSLASPAEEVHVPETCDCAECAAFLDRQRIQRIINLDVVPPSSGDCNEAADLELEVTRVVITRRKGGGQSATKPRTLSTCGSEAVTSVTCKAKNVDDKVCAVLRQTLAQAEKQEFLQGAPSSEKARTGCFASLAESTVSMVDSGCYAFAEGDRGAPDGCEGGATDEAEPEGRTTDDCEPNEEVFSIYDHSDKCASDMTASGIGDDSGSAVQGKPAEPPNYVEPELLVETSKKEGFDIKVENSALLYLTLKVFELDDEKLYKMFLAWKGFDGRGLLEPIYVLMTNKFLYILRPGAEVNQFVVDFSVCLSEVKVVTVWLNYQGFSLTCNSGKKTDVATGHAELTRNILSSLDLAVRRTHNGVKCLPSIVSHCSEQLDALKKLLAHELKAQESGSMGGMVACCLVLVGDLMLTLVEGSRVLGVGVIIDLSVVRSENNFCIMEFDGGEAESCAYNWIFWFATEEEKNEFLSLVSISWQEMFKVPTRSCS